MAFTKLTTDLIDGSLGIDWQTAVKTAAFTAVAGEGYFVNTTSAAITVTLPSSPSAGDEVHLTDYAGTADTNNITITSSDNINGSSDDVLIDYERGGVSIVYVDATQGWIAYNAANETATALPNVPNTFDIDYLVVAGGGGGGSETVIGAGGGGAGGLLQGTNFELTLSNSHTVTVGSGGALNTNGTNSVFSTISTTGGGKGGTRDGAGLGGGNGGSGGGTSSISGETAGTGVSGQGNAGGTGSQGSNFPSTYQGGGGGGAGEAGNTDGQSQGGDGLASSITGTSVMYAGGGAGAAGNNYGTRIGGTGGGGNEGSSGSGNFGGGGGARATGGSGVVILRYPNTYTVTIGSGLTGTTATDGSDKVTTFTAGTGNIQFS